MPGFNTRAVHEGQKPEPGTGAVIPPIYQTSTFAQKSPGEHAGFDYTRADNPNYQNLEACLASLEGAKYATVFSSGLGGETAVLSLLQAGDHVVAGNDLYGGTFRLMRQWGEKFGLRFTFVDTTSPEKVNRAIEKKTRLLWIETPTNPLLRISDIEALSAVAEKRKILTLVDNTFASPVLQTPLHLGADMVLHSTTKYIGGHSDVIGGVVMTNGRTIKDGLDFGRKAIGLNPSPFDCWLTQRGVKTLGLRMERHCANAMEIARFLEESPKVAKVYYPGLSSHPQHFLARRQMCGFGGMVSAEFKLTIPQTKKLISSFRYFTLAESLGGVESLVNHPATMTHASIPSAERKKAGLGDGLVRFSVGIEDVADLLQDLQQALKKIG